MSRKNTSHDKNGRFSNQYGGLKLSQSINVRIPEILLKYITNSGKAEFLRTALIEKLVRSGVLARRDKEILRDAGLISDKPDDSK